MAGATDFFREFYEDCEGLVDLRFLPAKRDVFVDPGAVADYALPAGENAYFGVATRRDGDGTKAGVVNIPAVWTDIDKKDLTAEQVDGLQARLLALPCFPSAIIASGGGWHVYWLLKEPAGPEDIPAVESVNRRLAAMLDGDPKSCDAARILRVPGSLNLKYTPPRPVTIEALDGDRRYNLADFDFLPDAGGNGKVAVGTLVAGVAEGARNNSMAMLAGRFLGKGLTTQEALSALIGANANNVPPLPEPELQNILASVVATHVRNHPGADPALIEHAREVRREMLRPRAIAEYLENPCEPEYLIDNILYRNAVTMLVSYAGLGKSLVMLSMALSVETGTPWLGRYKVLDPGPVLLYDEETPKPFMWARLTGLGFSAAARMSITHFADLDLLSDDFVLVTEAVQELKPVMIAFDSFIRVHRADENKSQEVARVMQRLRELANLGPAVVLVHHHGKGDGDLRLRSRGSSDIPAGIDLELALVEKEGFLILSSVKSRMRPIVPIRLRIEEPGPGRLKVAFHGEVRGLKEDLKTVISQTVAGAETDREHLEEAILAADLDAGWTSVRKALAEMVVAGQLVIRDGKKGKKWYFKPV